MPERVFQLALLAAVSVVLTTGSGSAQSDFEAYEAMLQQQRSKAVQDVADLEAEDFSLDGDGNDLAKLATVEERALSARIAGQNLALWAQMPAGSNGEAITFEPFVVGGGATVTRKFRDVVMLMKTKDAIEYDTSGPVSTFERNYGTIEPFAPKEGFCTGVFVSDATILTAAHCVCALELFNPAGRQTTMVMWGFDSGEQWVHTDPIRASRLDASASPELFDPLFCERFAATGRVQTADVALVHLDPLMADLRRVEKGLNERLVEFAWPALYFSEEQNTVMTVVGYGFNDIGGDGFSTKVAAEVPVVDRYCHRPSVVALVGCRLGQEIVLIDTIYGNDTCEGDSGGPAYIEYHGRYYLAGITSRGAISGGGCGSGGIYTLLTPKLQNWVRRNVKDFGLGL
ncbi:MAG: trypsin-like serine protease [Pseudomonadota bacterium]